jgi:metallo-beta-lactamase class B
MAYVDSLAPISAEGFKLAPIARSFERSYEVIAALPCDILITPHPDASGLWQRVADPVDLNACRAYAQRGRDRLTERLSKERAQ